MRQVLFLRLLRLRRRPCLEVERATTLLLGSPSPSAGLHPKGRRHPADPALDLGDVPDQSLHVAAHPGSSAFACLYACIEVRRHAAIVARVEVAEQQTWGCSQGRSSRLGPFANGKGRPSGTAFSISIYPPISRRRRVPAPASGPARPRRRCRRPGWRGRAGRRSPSCGSRLRRCRPGSGGRR
jgi:hypothetical protein